MKFIQFDENKIEHSCSPFAPDHNDWLYDEDYYECIKCEGDLAGIENNNDRLTIFNFVNNKKEFLKVYSKRFNY